MRLRNAAFILALVYVFGFAVRMSVRKYYIWLPQYVRDRATGHERPSGPVHLFFLVANHFEPGPKFEWTRRWASEYPGLASNHRDNSGRPVQQTWFYPGEQPLDENLRLLRQLVSGGYGEVELHYHHGNDTDESTRRKYREAVDWFQQFGFLKGVDGQTHFAFVHGNWGLDNSNGPEFCGAEHELRLLRELGSFADFTFPSINHDSQPAMTNQIYMASDDGRSKSYSTGVRVRYGRPVEGDLMIFEGPLLLAATWNPARLFFRVEDGNIQPSVPLSPRRVDLWVSANVHVEGRPDWVFVKVHGHGASSEADLDEHLGPSFDRMLSYMERRYNDGTKYVLHYITAREAYNLARAAAAGKQGDPRQYYDWIIPPYVANGGVKPPLEIETAASR